MIAMIATLVAFDALARNSTIMNVCRRDIALPGDLRLTSHNIIKEVKVGLCRTNYINATKPHTQRLHVSDPDTASLLIDYINSLPPEMAE